MGGLAQRSKEKDKNGPGVDLVISFECTYVETGNNFYRSSCRSADTDQKGNNYRRT